MELAEYIKFLWEEIIDNKNCNIKVFTDCKSLEEVLKMVGSTKNRPCINQGKERKRSNYNHTMDRQQGTIA